MNGLKDWSDEELMTLYPSGDHAAFECLYQIHPGKFIARAVNISRNIRFCLGSLPLSESPFSSRIYFKTLTSSETGNFDSLNMSRSVSVHWRYSVSRARVRSTN